MGLPSSLLKSLSATQKASNDSPEIEAGIVQGARDRGPTPAPTRRGGRHSGNKQAKSQKIRPGADELTSAQRKPDYKASQILPPKILV